MAKHTPGPWKARARHIFDVNRVLIAGAQYNPEKDPRGVRSREEQDANARLIAAAPELLDTLQRIAKVTDIGAETITPTYIKSLRGLARAAIDKAEGR